MLTLILPFLNTLPSIVRPSVEETIERKQKKRKKKRLKILLHRNSTEVLLVNSVIDYSAISDIYL